MTGLDKHYQLSGCTLILSGRFGDMVDMEFEINVADLLDLQGDLLTIDLTSVSYIGSYYIGVLTNASVVARGRDKRLRVVAGEEVAEVIEMVGLDQVG